MHSKNLTKHPFGMWRLEIVFFTSSVFEKRVFELATTSQKNA
jgi:hypothetical protein